MDPVDVFIISTPTQLLNALEARHAFPQGKGCLIVISRAYPLNKFELLIKPQDWDEIRYLSMPNQSDEVMSPVGIGRWQFYRHTIRFRLGIDRLARQVRPIRRLYLGFYDDNLMRHCANVFQYDELWLLDDGTGTLETNKFRRGEATDQTLSMRFRWKTRLSMKLMGVKTGEVEQVNYFSSYIFEPRPGDRLVNHKYEYLHSITRTLPILDEVFFLGGPLAERRRMKWETYRDYMARIRDHFKGENLVYLPHKRESKELLEKLRASLGLNIRPLDVPVEYYISIGGMRPKMLGTFYSSATENCRLILGEGSQIKAFYIRPEDLLSGHQSIEGIYTYYRSMAAPNFEVVEL